MKKSCLMLAVILGLISILACSACAENAMSPTLTVVLDKLTAADGSALQDGFLIEVIETEAYSDSVTALFDKISTALQDGKPISDYFDEAVMEAIADIEPASENLMVAEYIPIHISGLYEGIGDVDASFTVPGTYSDDDVVVAVFGLLNGEEMEWIPFQAKVVEGDVVVTFTQEAFEKVGTNETVLLLLREI